MTLSSVASRLLAIASGVLAAGCEPQLSDMGLGAALRREAAFVALAPGDGELHDALLLFVDNRESSRQLTLLSTLSDPDLADIALEALPTGRFRSAKTVWVWKWIPSRLRAEDCTSPLTQAALNGIAIVRGNENCLLAGACEEGDFPLQPLVACGFKEGSPSVLTRDVNGQGWVTGPPEREPPQGLALKILQ